MPPTEEGYIGGVVGNISMNGPGTFVGGANSQQPSQQKSNVVYFDTTKNELYRTSDTYKTLQVKSYLCRSNLLWFFYNKGTSVQQTIFLIRFQRKLKSSWKVQNNREDAAGGISLDALLQSRVFVISGPREKFTETEINHLKKYLETGGALLVLLGEGGEKRFDTNINFFLEEYGIMINSDAVVRTNYHKYFHPKVILGNEIVISIIRMLG